MPVAAELLDRHGRPVRLTDPSGGYFDAAGDFDRLIGHGSGSLRVWALVEAEEDAVLMPTQMAGLVADVTVLIGKAKPGPEERGLRRLLTMAEACRDDGTSSIRFAGD